MFDNRTDAGEQLAERLHTEGVHADVVLGIPRGALPVARPVADRLDLPLDIVAAKKMGAPNNPEYAIGAAAPDGSAWLNDEAIQQLDVSDAYLESAREQAAETAREKEETYREGPPEPIEGRRVLLVDDGVATGATMLASIRRLKSGGAESIIVAVPVGPPSTLDRIRQEADEVIALEEPARFGAVGRFYRNFGQVTDEEAQEYLTT
ncbi:MAG: phosphoribosyltransferase family protein [Halolamina sp.]|uniref:phosphoribosyltransferase n=1 Tax=Halolamina sp. TaxID=1940283 RepID=UPI002FC36B94